MTQYLRIRNWEKFQHYKDRRPIWIKYHVELLDDYELTTLDYVTQLLYDRLLLLAARTDNNIPLDPGYVSRMVSIEVAQVAVGLDKLLEQGFLVLAERKRSASKVIAKRSASAIPETEKETEKKEIHKEPEGLRASRDFLPALSGRPKPLGAGRDDAFALLLSRVTGGDKGTTKVLWQHCSKLPADRIEGVANKFSKRCVHPGVAVNALKAAFEEYDRDLRSEVVA
jgi:hypothetical protein